MEMERVSYMMCMTKNMVVCEALNAMRMMEETSVTTSEIVAKTMTNNLATFV